MDWKMSKQQNASLGASSYLPCKRANCTLSVSLNLPTICQIHLRQNSPSEACTSDIDISGKFNHVQRDPEDRGHRVEARTKPHFRNVIDVNLPVANVVAMS